MPQRDSELFLVAYDYGKGGLWGMMRAHTPDEIAAKYPELTIVAHRPKWMTDEDWSQLTADPYDIDAEPRGLVRAILADREPPPRP